MSDAGAFAGWAMTSFSKNQADAWKYIAFLLSSNAQETAWKVGNLVPNNVLSKVATTSPGMKKVFQLAKNPNNWTSYYTWTQAAYDTDRKFAPLLPNRRDVDQPDPRATRAGSDSAAAAAEVIGAVTQPRTWIV